MPYDQFVRRQIAGDVLEPDEPLAVIASGFLVVGPYDQTAYTAGTPPMRAFAREEELEGLVATVGQTFLGLTVHCARCHNHKFDPISQTEFYRFSAALGGTYHGSEREVIAKAGLEKAKKRVDDYQRQIEHLKDEEKSCADDARPELAQKRQRLESVLRLVQPGPVHTTQPKQPGAWHVLSRGDYKQPREVVRPGGIAALAGLSPDWNLAENAPEAERRKALARWLTDPHNPLTPRVIVNRLWAHHFGEGLVRTPSDFGFLGGQPSHPELLDWLAGQLVRPDDGTPWSLKRIQRLIVTSAAYRQSSRSVPAALQVDADNRLLWRQARGGSRRRPSPRPRCCWPCRARSTSGSAARATATGRPPRPAATGPYTLFDVVGGELNSRTLYRTCLRTGTSPLLDLLDCPDPSVATPKRTVTSTPLQALSLLNDRFMEHHADRFAARRSRGRWAGSPTRYVRAISWRSAGRRPTTEVDVPRRTLRRQSMGSGSFAWC